MSPLPIAAITAPTVASMVAGRYRLVAPLGRGASGAVYEAIDTVTDRVRAIKMVGAHVDDDARARFENEGTLAGRVESPHVVDVFDRGYDEAAGVYFLVMERLRGEDLGAHVARRGRLGLDVALSYLEQVAAGLDALHQEGVVHRDLKPENVFLAREGDAERVVIVDLGLAKSFMSSTARTTRAIGTPLYMSPEQLRGDALIDARADVYAFGQLAFALLVGHPYFASEHHRAGNLYALLLQVVKGPPEPASVRARAAGAELPPGFDAWFVKTTAPEPNDRFKRASEALRALLMGPETTANATRVASSRRSRRTRHSRYLASALAVLALGGGLASARLRGRAAPMRADDRASTITTSVGEPGPTEPLATPTPSTSSTPLDAPIAAQAPPLASPPPSKRAASRLDPQAPPLASPPPSKRAASRLDPATSIPRAAVKSTLAQARHDPLDSL